MPFCSVSLLSIKDHTEVIEVLSLFWVNFNVTLVEGTVGSCYCSENRWKTQACFY